MKGWPDELKQELKEKLVMIISEVICNHTVGLELGKFFFNTKISSEKPNLAKLVEMEP